MKRRNPGHDKRLRALERAAAAGDQDARLQLAKHRIRAGRENDEDVWIGLVHDVRALVAPMGWTVEPWYWSPRQRYEDPVETFEQQAFGRMRVTDPEWGLGWGTREAEISVLIEAPNFDIEVEPGRFLSAIHGQAPTSVDRDLAQELRVLLSAHR